MNKRKHYLVYKITNLTNGKTYIGKHETYDVNDGYMGSGELLNLAKKKYGLENFKREILFDFDSREEMNRKEVELVDEQFVRRADTYNAALGGTGGFYHVNSKRKNWSEEQWIKFAAKRTQPTETQKSIISKRLSVARKKRILEYGHNWIGRHHTEESKRKIREHHLKVGYQKGNRNSQFGKHWWMNPVTKESHSFFDKDVPEGWIRGRKMPETGAIRFSDD